MFNCKFACCYSSSWNVYLIASICFHTVIAYPSSSIIWNVLFESLAIATQLRAKMPYGAENIKIVCVIMWVCVLEICSSTQITVEYCKYLHNWTKFVLKVQPSGMWCCTVVLKDLYMSNILKELAASMVWYMIWDGKEQDWGCEGIHGEPIALERFWITFWTCRCGQPVSTKHWYCVPDCTVSYSVRIAMIAPHNPDHSMHQNCSR